MIPLLLTIVVWMALKMIIRAVQVSIVKYPRIISRRRCDDVLEMFIDLAIVAWAALLLYQGRP
jgi:hypothetical protein